MQNDSRERGRKTHKRRGKKKEELKRWKVLAQNPRRTGCRENGREGIIDT